MESMQFGIRHLLILTAFVGVGCWIFQTAYVAGLQLPTSGEFPLSALAAFGLIVAASMGITFGRYMA